jgi:hypothetical protein
VPCLITLEDEKVRLRVDWVPLDFDNRIGAETQRAGLLETFPRVRPMRPGSTSRQYKVHETPLLRPTGMPDLSSLPSGDTGRSSGTYGDNLNSIQPVRYLAIPIGTTLPTSSISVTERGVSLVGGRVRYTSSLAWVAASRLTTSWANVVDERCRNLPTGRQIQMPPTIGTAMFPSTHGYIHFRASDYGKLTVIGVVIACLGWPIVTQISSAPRWLYLRLAILVTLVLWLPDLFILIKGQPPKAVAILMLMHVAIAVITYNCMVHLAKVGEVEPAMSAASSA